MNNYFLIYLFTRLDSIKDFVSSFTTLSVIMLILTLTALAITSLLCYIEDDELTDDFLIKIKKVKPFVIAMVVIFLLTKIVDTLIPTRNEAIIIVAGGKTIDYVQSDTSLQKIPYQTSKIISDYLERQLDSAKKELTK